MKPNWKSRNVTPNKKDYILVHWENGDFGIINLNEIDWEQAKQKTENGDKITDWDWLPGPAREAVKWRDRPEKPRNERFADEH